MLICTSWQHTVFFMHINMAIWHNFMIHIHSIIFFGILMLSLVSSAIADDDDDKDEYHDFNVKALHNEGKIASLESILNNLAKYKLSRLLEVELVENKDHPDNSEYLYQIEYINPQGKVLELEVDALTSQVLQHGEDIDKETE